MNQRSRLWVSRFMIALVTVWNLQAALAFILRPERFAPGFELTGIPGAAAVRGTGILFVMWNVPYVVALWEPYRYRLALRISFTMQLLGLFGESLIWINLPQEHALLRASILRFIGFDASGLILLTAALWLSNRNAKPS